MDAIEAMETCRAMRFLAPDPVPDDTVERLVFAATRASNPGNSQAWEFVALRDAAKKERIGKAVAEAMAPAYANRDPNEDDVRRRMMDGASHLATHFARVPLWMFVCARNIYPPAAPNELFVWSAVYPASQNLIVAARSLGLGSTFTTYHLAAEAVVRETLEIPDDVFIGTSIALGRPERNFGPLARKPVRSVLHWDQW